MSRVTLPKCFQSYLLMLIDDRIETNRFVLEFNEHENRSPK